jgi:hypothetical protein
MGKDLPDRHSHVFVDKLASIFVVGNFSADPKPEQLGIPRSPGLKIQVEPAKIVAVDIALRVPDVSPYQFAYALPEKHFLATKIVVDSTWCNVCLARDIPYAYTIVTNPGKQVGSDVEYPVSCRFHLFFPP